MAMAYPSQSATIVARIMREQLGLANAGDTPSNGRSSFTIHHIAPESVQYDFPRHPRAFRLFPWATVRHASHAIEGSYCIFICHTTNQPQPSCFIPNWLGFCCAQTQ